MSEREYNKIYPGQTYGGYKVTGMEILDRRRKRREILYDVSVEYLWDIFRRQNSRCALSCLFLELSLTAKGTSNASVDRINNDLGYIVGNVQWVHKDVNIMKNTFDQEYFKELCHLITEQSSEAR